MSQVKSKETSGKFSAGHLTNPQPRDQRFEKFDEAMYAACDRSKDDDAWAVWEDESGEILAIVYQQQVFTP
ncbi:MAG: hypothetical protein HZB51_13900 [Chloroflexi bacterium]|nr:hypothetical protein [Chloroflexota bacterium]